LKYGVVVAMAAVRVAVNSLQWAADRAAMLEKQLGLHLVNNIDCVQAAQAAALKHVKVLRDSLAMFKTTQQVHIQLAYALVADLAATQVASILYLAAITVLQ